MGGRKRESNEPVLLFSDVPSELVARLVPANPPKAICERIVLELLERAAEIRREHRR